MPRVNLKLPSSVTDFIILIAAITAFACVGAAIAKWQYNTTGGHASTPQVCYGGICYTPGTDSPGSRYFVNLGGSEMVLADSPQELNMMMTYGIVGAVLGLLVGIYNSSAKRTGSASPIDPNNRF